MTTLVFTVNNRKTKGRPLYPRRYNRIKLSKAELHAKRDASRVKWEDINGEIEDWYSRTVQLANDLGEWYGHQARFFLDRMYFRGAKVWHCTKTNAYNAWSSKKMAEVNKGTHHSSCSDACVSCVT